MAVFSDLQRDTLAVLRLKLSRNKFASGYPVTEGQIAICSATGFSESQYLRDVHHHLPDIGAYFPDEFPLISG